MAQGFFLTKMLLVLAVQFLIAVWVLRKLAKSGIDRPIGKGVYYDGHELVNSNTGVALSLPTWGWAEADSSRLVWTDDGKLFAAQLSHEGRIAIKELHDFSNYTHQRLKAPY